MKKIKHVIIVCILNTILNAASGQLYAYENELKCESMQVIVDPKDLNHKRSWTEFRFGNYSIAYKVGKKNISSFEIIENNSTLKKLILNEISAHDYTNAKICEDSNQNHYFVLEQGNFEAENEDGGNLTGKIIEILTDVNESKNLKYFSGIFYDQYLKGAEKIKSQYRIFSGYTPQKLLNQDKYLPITPTLFEKDSGLYMKVGSTYKSDTITLKKPTSGK